MILIFVVFVCLVVISLSLLVPVLSSAVTHFGQVLSGAEAMPNRQLNLTNQKLKTPRAAALAGILFTVLFSMIRWRGRR